jgi:hypothetical protein
MPVTITRAQRDAIYQIRPAPGARRADDARAHRRDELRRVRELTHTINALETEIADPVAQEGLLGGTLGVSSRSDPEEARVHVARWSGSESAQGRRA